MSNLRELKKKIVTTNKIKKIFVVMKMIASSKMKKAQNDVHSSNSALNLINEMLLSSIKKSSDSSTILSNLVPLNKKAPILYLLISSDKGLCGNYNNLVLRKINAILKENSESNHLIAFAGNKIKNILSSKINQQKILKNISNFKFNDLINNHKNILSIFKEIESLFFKGEISECKILYVHSENAMSKNIKIENLFHSSANTQDSSSKIQKNHENEEENPKNKEENIIFEPNESQIAKNLKFAYLRAKFFNIFRNAYLSEVSSRMVAMDNASRNSSELVKSMTLKYNKKRQEKITKELIDIINGAENI
jgi:F-type H+-transporting ATPase subunit gamma